MTCDKINTIITEPEKLITNISETEDLIVTIDKVDKLGNMTYTIDFNENNTDWGFYSKHFGNITKIETTNISSYTIDGAAVSLPLAVELNTTYLVKITKTASGTAQIILTITPSEYDELRQSINFNIGNGKKTYAVSSVDDKIYKIDNTLFVPSNYVGAGVWSINPLELTITLPLLPSGGYWINNLYVYGKTIVYGANTGNNDTYYSYINSDDTVTDLNGNLNSFTTHTGLTRKIQMVVYNYVDNIVYFSQYLWGSKWIMLDLNNNIFVNKSTLELAYAHINYKSKKFFNFIKNTFAQIAEIDIINNRFGLHISIDGGIRYSISYNRMTGLYGIGSKNHISKLHFINQKGNIHSTLGNTSMAGGVLLATLDHLNNVYINCGGGNKFCIFRVDDLNYDSFILSNAIDLTAIRDGMYAFNNLHLLLDDSFQRLHCIDTTNPSGTIQPDFAYYDFPTKVNGFYTNRLL